MSRWWAVGCLGGLLVILLVVGCHSRSGQAAVPAWPATEEQALQARATLLLAQVAQPYKPPGYPPYPSVSEVSDDGKYRWPITLARLRLHGPQDEAANAYLRAAGGRDPFHFEFPGLARLLAQFGEAPACGEVLPTALAKVFARKDQYNAFTGEGTENHIAMSRCPGLIFSQLATRHGVGEGAPARLAEMRTWIGQWSRLAVEKGGGGEWNSGTYAAYNLIPWLLVYDFADRAEERASAQRVLDLYATDLARKCSGGALGGAESRSSRQDTSRTWNSAEYLLWFWFSAGAEAPVWKGAEYLPLVHLALSRYRPPSDLLALARKHHLPPTEWRQSLPDYLLQFPNRSGEIFYATSAYTLGSAQLDWGGWTNGSLQLLPWKLVAWNSAGQHRLFWGNSGYRSTRHARGRNPFDQLVQHRNILVQITRIPRQAAAIESQLRGLIDDPQTGWRALHARDFTARWGYPPGPSPIRYDPQHHMNAPSARQSRLFFPPDLPPQEIEGVFFWEWEQLCVAARPLSGRPVTWDDQYSALVDSADFDALSGWLLETALSGEDGGGASFRHNVLTNASLHPHPELPNAFIYHTRDGHLLEFRYATAGAWREPAFDFSYGVTEPSVSMNRPDWRQPDWPSGENHGRLPTWTFDGRTPPPLP